MINIYVKLFNLIRSTGLIPEQWLTSIIQPIYKNKGEKNVNSRLSKFLEDSGVLGEEQAGFRKGYSTLDHVFTFKCLLDLYTSKKKRLYCCFVDYRKAFDTIDRTNLWRKLLANDINGRIFKVIHNLYKGAKACVRKNGKFSNYFDSLIGVRQGDNLSPLLFAIYLNDLELFMSHQYPGLK